MKNFTKALGCLFIAAVMGLTSCIKNDVAPEVDALRKAQVEKLLAQIESIKIDNRVERMDLYFDSLFNALDLEEAEAYLQVTLANYDNRMAVEETMQQQNELLLAQKVAEYQRFINQGQFSTNVSELLSKYSQESQVLNQLYSDRTLNLKQIAEKRIALTTNNWDVLQARYEIQLAELNAKLDAQKEALATLESAYTSPATIETEKVSILAEMAILKDSVEANTAELKVADKEWKVALDLAARAQTVIDLMETNNAMYPGAGYTKTLADANASLPVLNATLAAQNQTLTNNTSTLTAAQTALTSAKTAYDAKLAAFNTAVANQTAAQNDIDAKNALLTIAINNYNAGLAAVPALSPEALAALLTAKNNAQTAYDAAVTVRDAATGTAAVLASATAAKNAAEGTYNASNTAVTLAKAAVTTAQDNVTSTTATIAQTQQKISNVQAEITRLQAEYDAAKANIAQLNAKAIQLSIKPGELTALNTRINARLTELTAVYTALTTQSTNLGTEISAKKTDIANTESLIATKQTDIATGQKTKAELENEIVKFEAVLAATEQKIANSEAIVAYWQKLLDEALTAVE